MIVMEDLGYCECLNQVNHPERWEELEIEAAIKTLAFFHCHDLCEERYKKSEDDLEDWNGIAGFLEEFEDSMERFAGMQQMSELKTAARAFIHDFESYEKALGGFGKQMIHNDFNIRNICMDKQNGFIKVYDWEFLDYKNPVMDLVDLFISFSESALQKERLDYYIGLYLSEKNELSGRTLALSELKEQMRVNVMKFLATRMNMYLLFYAEKQKHYIERMYRNLRLLLAYCDM